MLKSRKSEKTQNHVSETNIVVDNRAKHTRGHKNNKAEMAVPKSAKIKKHQSRTQVFRQKHGWTVVRINSKNAQRVLGELAKVTKIKVFASSEDGVEIAFKSKHLGQIIAILQNLCYDYKIIKIIGAVPSFLALASRLGIVVGTVATLVVLVICSEFVTRVSVDGVRDAHLRIEIAAMLESKGVKRGGRAKDVNCDLLAKDILALDGVAFCSVKRNGGQISVFVKEEQNPAEFEEIDGSAVTAKKRAVVTRVVVNGGTAVVKYGDVVEVGDILIDGYTEYGDDRISVQAAGEVYGKVYYQKKLYFANTTFVRTYGDTKKVTKLSFFGVKPKTPKCRFENFELEVTKSRNGLFLPYEIYTFEFKEISVEELDVNLFDEDLKRQAYAQVLAEIDTAVKVLGTHYKIENAPNGKYVTVTVEAEENIS